MQVLGQNKKTVTIYFIVCSLTGPIMGVVIGGLVFSRLGGYNSPKAFPLCVLIFTIGGAVGFPIPFVDNFKLCALLLWAQFFCGGFIMPVLTGILLNKVPPSLRT